MPTLLLFFFAYFNITIHIKTILDINSKIN